MCFFACLRVFCLYVCLGCVCFCDCGCVLFEYGWVSPCVCGVCVEGVCVLVCVYDCFFECLCVVYCE